MKAAEEFINTIHFLYIGVLNKALVPCEVEEKISENSALIIHPNNRVWNTYICMF